MEVTPLGIQNLQWKFYVSRFRLQNRILKLTQVSMQIIWTLLNASFVPIIYLFYPETSDRTLEDMDRLFRENHSIFVFRDKDAISPHRPANYIEYEQTQVRRNSSVAVTPAQRQRLASRLADKSSEKDADIQHEETV